MNYRRPVRTPDIDGDSWYDFFGEENCTNIAVKFEHAQNNSVRYRGDVNLENRSKIAGCSHVRIFLAIEIAEKIPPKIVVNIVRVNGA